LLAVALLAALVTTLASTAILVVLAALGSLLATLAALLVTLLLLLAALLAGLLLILLAGTLLATLLVLIAILVVRHARLLVVLLSFITQPRIQHAVAYIVPTLRPVGWRFEMTIILALPWCEIGHWIVCYRRLLRQICSLTSAAQYSADCNRIS
jgi:hypothetical protein